MQRAALFRRERQFVWLLWFCGFICVNLRERHWGFFVQYRLSKLTCLFSRRLRRSRREECSGAALFHRERLFVVRVVLGFVCDYLRDLREIFGFRLCYID